MKCSGSPGMLFTWVMFVLGLKVRDSPEEMSFPKLSRKRGRWCLSEGAGMCSWAGGPRMVLEKLNVEGFRRSRARRGRCLSFVGPGD